VIFLRAQAPSDHWKIGDWWKDRHFDIACDDPGVKNGHSCKKEASPGDEVEPTNRVDDGKYPLSNFCSAFW